MPTNEELQLATEQLRQLVDQVKTLISAFSNLSQRVTTLESKPDRDSFLINLAGRVSTLEGNLELAARVAVLERVKVDKTGV